MTFGRRVARKADQKRKAVRDAVATESIAQVAAILARDCVPQHLAFQEAKRLLSRTLARMREEQLMAKSMGVEAGKENDDLHATILQREILALIANWRARTGKDPIDPKVLEKFGVQVDDRYKAVVDIVKQNRAASTDGRSLVLNDVATPLAPSRAAEIGTSVAEGGATAPSSEE